MTKREQSLLLFEENKSLFCCPLCRSSFRTAPGGSLVCQSGHCYDVAKKGYVNFVPNQKATHYNTGLFLNRRQIFEDGFYEPVLSSLANIIEENTEKSKPRLLLDAGCGEGFYTGALKKRIRHLSAFGVDLSREAVRLACGRTEKLCLSVADLAALPFKDGSMDILLNILTPANYREFKRVLKPEGLFIKLIPGKHYLCEIRGLIRDKLLNQADYEGKAAAYLLPRLKDAGNAVLTYTRPVTEEQARAFLSMTPLTFGVSPEELPESGLQQITIDVQIYFGRL